MVRAIQFPVNLLRIFNSIKMKAVIVVLALVGFVQATNLKDVLKEEFQAFKVKHGKTYQDISEELRRMKVFKDNVKIIEEHNKRFAAGEETYEMGVNQFSDMSPSEFKRLMLTDMKMDDLEEENSNIYNTSARANVPSSFDWRYYAAVNALKNQGSCGSCYAFAAVGALESHHFIKKGQRVSLSEQNVVDCSSRAPYNNLGCQSGWVNRAYDYIRDYGVDTANYYPYQDYFYSCRYNNNYIGSRIYGYSTVPRETNTHWHQPLPMKVQSRCASIPLISRIIEEVSSAIRAAVKIQTTAW